LPPFTVVLLRVDPPPILKFAISDRAAQRATGRPGAPFRPGLLSNVMPFCHRLSQTHIASGHAAIPERDPRWTVIVAHLLTSDGEDDRQPARRRVVSFIGVVVMIGPTRSLASAPTWLHARRVAAGVLCSPEFMAAIQADGQRAVPTATGQVTASTVMLLPVALIVDHPWTLPMPSHRRGRSARHVALTALACALFSHPGDGRSTNLPLVTFLIPVSAILLGSAGAGRAARPSHFLGLALSAPVLRRSTAG
jgi:hypothetical protein